MSKQLLWGLFATAAFTTVAVGACSISDTKTNTQQTAHDAHSNHESMHMASHGPVANVPEYIDNFRLIDHAGKSHELYYEMNAKAVVIMTHGNGCPIVRGAVPDYMALKEQFADQDIEFWMINSNPQDTRADLAAEAAEFNIDMPILHDVNQIIGESMGYDRTAQVFVLDPAQGFKVVYYGPLNDRQTYERQRAEAKEHYVKDVLNALMAGDEITTKPPAIRAGCMINFLEKDKRDEHAKLTYVNDIAPILEEKCVECHQEGGIGPWAMTDYDAVSGWAPMIREVVRTDRMPPWHPDPEIGKLHENRDLTNEQVKTLIHWIEAGAPRGEGEDPLAKLEHHAPEWPLGEPDLILTAPEYTVPANGVVDYVYPVIENPLTEDKWLRATTIKAGNRQVVHHVLSGYLSDVPEDAAASTGRWEFNTGSYAVGSESAVQPDDAGVPFPAGGVVALQMHYTPYGKEVTDQTRIGFYFHDETPELINRTATIIDASIEIPAGEARHLETAYMEFPHDAELFYVFPHAHYRGYSSNLKLQYPDGEEKMLLSLPRYDFNWQRAYWFEDIVEIPAGSKLIAEYVYDNSEDNLANPDPEANVTWGEQSFEEMLYTRLSYRWKGETTANRMDEKDVELQTLGFFGAMDDNMDGRLVEAELKGMMGSRMKAGFQQMDFNKDGAVSKEEWITVRKFMGRGNRPQ